MSHLPFTSQTASTAAEGAAINKEKKYKELSKAQIFIPVAVETFGAWSHAGLSLFQQFGKRISKQTGEVKSTSHLLQEISMAIQRGNAASVMGTLPKSALLPEL